MIEGNKVIGVIPARGKSKGIPQKNIKPLLGEPLIGWTINESRKSEYIDRLIVSSDDDGIIAIAREYGVEVPFVRPPDLARDDTAPIDVTFHALNECPGFDLVVVLQPTSPLRKVEDIDGVISKMIVSGAPACVSITLSDKSPYWMFKTDQEDKLLSLFPNVPLAANRQELPAVYALNGAVFAANAKTLIEQGSFICPETVGYIMPHTRSIDIDNEIDFDLCSALMKVDERG